MNINKTKILYIALFPASLLLSSCGGGAGTSATTDNFPVDAPLAAALVSQGLPADIAQFFAAVKFSSNCSSDTTTCTYSYTYPNGAKRSLTLTATPNQYTPTADELANTATVTNPVYDGKFAATGIEDSTPPVNTQIDISYFVPTTSVPKSASANAQASPLTKKTAKRLAQVSASGASPGYQFSWSDSASKGADVTISSIFDYYHSIGKTGASLSNIFGLASAASDMASAAIIGKQVFGWYAELDALEKCASDPSNKLTQTDPGYADRTVANLKATRAELKQIFAVRIINILGETSAGLHPATAVLSIPLKQAYSWTEQSLKDASEKLMQDARKSVVSCKPSCPTSFAAQGVSESRIDLSWNASIVSSGVNAITSYSLSGGNTNGVVTADTMFPDIGLAKSTQYCYTISAYDDFGTSAICPRACGTTWGPPVIHSTGPNSGATKVSVKTAVTATFSGDVDAATVTAAGTFTLRSSGGAVGGTLSYSGTTATFTPSADLAYSTTYTATVTTAVLELHGIPMEANKTWSFTTEGAPLEGNLQFSTTVTDSGVNTTNGVANVTWTLSETLPDVITYTASGTISGSLAPVLAGFTCTPLAVTSKITTTDKLLVYTAANTLWPNTHAFTVTADDMNTTLTTDCTDDSSGTTIPIQFSKLLYVFVGGNCLPSYTPEPVPFTDAAQLSGTYSCPGAINFSGTNATWDFSK